MKQDNKKPLMQNIINRLQRIEGQVRGLQKMVIDQREAIEILTQVSSVLSATRRASGVIACYYMHQYLEYNAEEADPELAEQLTALIDSLSNL